MAYHLAMQLDMVVVLTASMPANLCWEDNIWVLMYLYLHLKA